MSTDYEFTPPKRPTNYVYPSLSARDEYIPKTHIGMYSIFRNPRNKNVYMSEKHCQAIRQKTFNGVLNLYKKYGSPDFADFFNYNNHVICEIGLNHFANHPKIAPVVSLIECFQCERVINGHYDIKKMIISFAINRELLFQYFETGNVPIIERKKKSRDLILFGEEQIKVDTVHSVPVERNALYRKFDDWCALQGVDMQEGISMALEALFERYPIDSLKDTAAYDFLTEFDKPLFARPKYNPDKVERRVEFSGTICELSDKIIERYNRDPVNLTKKIDFNTYVNNALYLLNSNMDLKYQDPELYKEKLDTEEFIRYNTRQGGDINA